MTLRSKEKKRLKKETEKQAKKVSKAKNNCPSQQQQQSLPQNTPSQMTLRKRPNVAESPKPSESPISHTKEP